ncbi:MAG: hypothetical protein P8P29_03790 [Flavobacteriaceae bacterium]|nr:hypothetical protein [Flavobacteriaceae bacterium]
MSGNTYTFYAGDEKIDGSSGSSYLANQTGLVEGATVDDLKAYWDSAENLQSQFNGDWNKYLAYMDERQSLIDSGEYSVGEYGQIVETSAVQNVDGTMIEPSDIQNLSKNDFIAKYGMDPSEVQLVQTDTTGSRQQGFTEWSQSDAVVALNEKYGIDQLRTTEEGREYQWNGTAYVKTKDYDNLDFGGIAEIVAKAGLSGAIGAGLAPVLAGGLGVTSATGVGAIQGAVGATVGGAINGDIDPKNIAISALMAGVNPGGTLSNQMGLAPENFAGGFVQGSVNSLIGDGLRTGELDAGSILQSGLLQGGMNSLTNAWDALNNNTPEALMESISDQHRADYIKIHGSAAGYQGLSENVLYDAAMSMPLVNKTNFGALIGEGGLLPFIPELDISGLAQLQENMFGYDQNTELFYDPEGNYLTNAELIAAGQDPVAVFEASLEGGAGIDGYTHAGYVDNPPGLLEQITDKITSVANQTPIGPMVGGLMDAAAAEAFKNEYGFYPQDDPLLAQQVVAYGPLQENYSYSDNPRGDSEMFGTVYDNGNYTQGLTTLIDAVTGLPSAITVSQEQISAINEAGDAAREQQQQLLNNGYIINLGDQPTLPGAGLGNPFWEQFVESLTSSDPDETASTEITDAGVVDEEEFTDDTTEQATTETTEQVVDNVGDDPTQNTTTETPSNSNYRRNQITEMLGNTIASIPEAVLPPDPSTQLPPGSTPPTLPGIDPRANPNNGVNPEWGELYKYKQLEKWKKARDRQYAGIAGLLQQQGNPLNNTKRKYTQRQKSDMGLLS